MDDAGVLLRTSCQGCLADTVSSRVQVNVMRRRSLSLPTTEAPASHTACRTPFTVSVNSTAGG